MEDLHYYVTGLFIDLSNRNQTIQCFRSLKDASPSAFYQQQIILIHPLPPSSGCDMPHLFYPERCYLSVKLCGVTSQMTIIWKLTDVGISNLTRLYISENFGRDGSVDNVSDLH